jgi:UDPglucose 6-dehydrogenase
MDSRIGPKYLKGAVSYGGPCFPRDNGAFAALGARLGVRTLLPEVTDQMNRAQIATLAGLVVANLPPGGVVGILGLSYKPETSVCEASAGALLARHLHDAGIPVIAYDPMALDEARRILNLNIACATSTSECARQADVLVICVAWSEFATLSPDDLRRPTHRPLVIDCWRLLKPGQLAPTANVIVLGVGPSLPRSAEPSEESC